MSTLIRAEPTVTLQAIVAGADSRSSMHWARIVADRELERRKALAVITRLTATVTIVAQQFGMPFSVRFADEGRGYGVDPFDNLLDAGAAAFRWLNATAA